MPCVTGASRVLFPKDRPRTAKVISSIQSIFRDKSAQTSQFLQFGVGAISKKAIGVARECLRRRRSVSIFNGRIEHWQGAQ
jgi:hypothetical protein